MSPHRLAWRTLLLGKPRSLLAIAIVGAALAALDLLAGHMASVRTRLEYQAVVTERFGHLAIWRAGTDASGHAQRKSFDAREAALVRQVASGMRDVALLMPQMNVSGMASTGQRSTLFFGQGVDLAGAQLGLPGKLAADKRAGIAVSSAQAQSMGLQQGSNVMLTGATADAPTTPQHAEIVDIYTSSNPHALVMPFQLAQTLLDTERIERFVVYLHTPANLEASRHALLSALRQHGIRAEIRSWQEQSGTYARERAAAELAFDSMAGMVFAVIAATIAATLSMNAFERRREVATLRAMGMRAVSVFFMFAAEALLMAGIGVAAGALGSSVVAWTVNRATLAPTARFSGSHAPMMVELDAERMLMAVLAVLAVALLAALLPAFKAARASIAQSLGAAT